MKAQLIPPALIEGFFEGLVAPILEYAAIAFIFAFALASQSIELPVTDIIEIFVLFILFEVIRNLILGISAPKTGAAYIFGAIVGLLIMSSAASAHESVVVIGIIAVLLGIGIRVYFWYINQEQ